GGTTRFEQSSAPRKWVNEHLSVLHSLARRPHGNSVAPCRLERHGATEIRETLGIAGDERWQPTGGGANSCKSREAHGIGGLRAAPGTTRPIGDTRYVGITSTVLLERCYI